MPDTVETVGDLVDRLPPVDPVAVVPPGAKPPAKPERHSITVKKLGMELHNALLIRAALRAHDDPQLILDTIEGETDLTEACCAVYEETLEDEILLAGLKAKLEELEARKGRAEKSIELRRTIILMAMDKAGIDNIKSPLATLTRSKTAAKVEIVDEAQIPTRFWKPAKPVDPTLDRAALKEALQAKEDVPGAKLGNEGINLTIRTK